MTLTVTLDRPDRTEPGRLRRATRAARTTLTAAARAALRPHRASLTRLAQMPLTVIAAGCLDYAAWHANAGLGWLTIALSLLVLEHLIADDDPEPR